MLFSMKNLSPDQMAETEKKLGLLDIPFSGWTDTAPRDFEGKDLSGQLFQAWVAALTPGAALPGQADWLPLEDAGTSMVLRRAGQTAAQLAELLNTPACPAEGGHLLNGTLYVPHPGPQGQIEGLLPPGIWTELFTGQEISGVIRCMANPRRLSLWCAENALIPVVHPMAGLTLHWFRPAASAQVHACGALWTAYRNADGWRAENEAGESCHLIIRINGTSSFVR